MRSRREADPRRDARCERQELLAILAYAGEDAYPRPHQKKRCVVYARPFGQRLEPGFYGRYLARQHVPEPMPDDKHAPALVVLSNEGVPDGLIEEPRVL